MNVNCKLTLTDEERNAMHNRLTGTSTKKMVSRADVNTWVKDQLERFIKRGSPDTEQIGDKIADAMKECIEPINLDEIDVEEVMKQNELLLTRVNRLQFLLDTS